jgi:hypothetical protein
MKIKISNRSLKQKFACNEYFIKNICHGACCRKSTGGTLIVINPSEEARFLSKGVEIKNHRIICGNKCPFQNEHGLCSLHATNEKPFGCIASPFTLSKRGALIIRNRYRLFKCFKANGAQPAYITFRKSLELILGDKEKLSYLINRLECSDDDFIIEIRDEIYNILRENDLFKHG